MTGLQWTEIDGVKTVWADIPGPTRAGLLFRTGSADETLVTAGDVHLLEHLALASIGSTPDRVNGSTGPVATVFHAVGAAEHVAELLQKICAALRRLPGDLMENERSVLTAESAGRQYSPLSRILARRYGAQGHGLAGLNEIGLKTVTIERLQARSDLTFTRDNAILWMSSAPPAGMSLDLPGGDRQPIPTPVPLARKLPGWFVDDSCGGIASASLVERNAVATIAAQVARRGMTDVLRLEKGISYSPAVAYDPIDADIAQFVLFADSEPDRRRELANEFGEVLGRLGDVDDMRVAEIIADCAERWLGSLAPSPDDMLLGELQRMAVDWIHGRPFKSIEELVEETRAVTADDVSAFMRGLESTRISAVPGKAKMQTWMGDSMAECLAVPVEGAEMRSIDYPVRTEILVNGCEGITIRFDDGSHTTMRYDELAGALSFDDGGLCLVDRNGGILNLDPQMWRAGDEVRSDVVSRIPPELVVPGGARSPEDIPRPSTTASQRAMNQGSKIIGWGVIAVCAILALCVVYFIAPFSLELLRSDPGESAAPAFLVFGPLILLAIIGYVGYRMVHDAA